MPLLMTKATVGLVSGLGVGVGAPASIATLFLKENSPFQFAPIPEICEDDPNAPTEYNCAESLFRWGNTAYDDLIGCYNAIVRKDTETGTKFESFSIQVALRKGNKGWTIDSWVKNEQDKHEAGYIFSEISLEESVWKVTDSYSWRAERGSNTPDNKLKINIPIAEEISMDWKEKVTGIISLDDRNEVSYNGYWISENNGTSDWMFSDIKLRASNNERENIWCSSADDCFSLDKAKDFKQIKHTLAQPWLSYHNNTTYIDSGLNTSKSKVKSMVDTIQGTKGRWAKLQGRCAMIKQGKIKKKNMSELRPFWTNFKYPTTSDLEGLKKLAEKFGVDHTQWLPRSPQDQ